MAEIVPVDQFLEWYSGLDAGAHRLAVGGRAPRAVHQGGRGPVLVRRLPLAPRLLADGLPVRHRLRGVGHADGGALAAAAAGQGPRPRAWAGPFPYESEVPTTSAWELGFRAARIERNMPKFLQNFDAIWEERKWELELGLGYFESYDFDGASLADIGQFLADARTFHRRAWEIHFELMYPLLGIYLQLYGLCASNGIDPGNVSKFLQGRDSRIMQTDRAMWDLVAEAKRLGIADLFDTEPDQIRDRLAKAGGNASVWLTKFDDFLQDYGWRTEGIADTNIPSWIENPASPLGQIRNFLSMDEPHDFEKAAAAAQAERDEAIEAARSQFKGEMVNAFDELLAHQPGGQLRLVERGPQLLHRPAGLDPAPARRARPRRRLRSRHLRRRAVPLLPGGDRRVRRAPPVEGPPVVGDRPPRVLRPLQRDPRVAAEGRRHRCRTRSRTRCSSRSSACTTTTSKA